MEWRGKDPREGKEVERGQGCLLGVTWERKGYFYLLVGRMNGGREEIFLTPTPNTSLFKRK